MPLNLGYSYQEFLGRKKKKIKSWKYILGTGNSALEMFQMARARLFVYLLHHFSHFQQGMSILINQVLKNVGIGKSE